MTVTMSHKIADGPHKNSKRTTKDRAGSAIVDEDTDDAWWHQKSLDEERQLHEQFRKEYDDFHEEFREFLNSLRGAAFDKE